MKRSLRKITTREIWRSFGRFMAIMLIVMLGSGFLTGLRVTKTAMIKTLNGYDVENHFFDFRVVSTLGLTDEDVTYFSSLRGVESAEGAMGTDALFLMENGSKIVLKAHTVPESIDMLKLRYGRMPEKPYECVLDAWYFSESDVGGSIEINSDNSADTLDMFAYGSYKVVGLVNSPLYINFTRGTTTLGSGSVAGFVYLPKDGFGSEYYTDVYLRLAQTGGVYTEKYDDAIEDFEDNLTEAAEMRADKRYQGIVDEAMGEYNKALAEYNDGVDEYTDKKKDAEAELEDAAAELEDGRRSLNSARWTLDDGWVKLRDGEAKLKTGWEEYNASLPDAQAKLADAKTEIDAGLAQYEAGLAQYEENLVPIAEAEAQYQTGLEQYLAAVETYGEAALTSQKAQLDATRAQLDAARAPLDAAKAELDASKAKLDEAQAQYDSGVAELEKARNDLLAAETEIEKNRAGLESGERTYYSSYVDLARGREEYAKARAEADEEFADAEAELSDAERELADAKEEIDDIERPDVFVLDRYTNSGYAGFESDSDIVEGVAKVFPIFFFLVAALVCVTTMNRMVDEQRTQIGTLKSLGYGSWEIMRGYLLYTGLAAGIGSVVGVILGSIVFPKMIWQAYNIMYGFTEIELCFDWQLSAVVCAAFLFCSLAVTYLSCRNELREVPAELVRPRTPKAGKRIFLERIPFLWNGFSFLRKVSARNIFRYKKRMYMMIVGIAGCTALLITGFGLNDSITGLADTQFDEVAIYDAQVSFTEDMTEADRNGFLEDCGDAVTDCAFLSMYSVDADVGGILKSVYLVATDEDMEPFMRFYEDGVEQRRPGKGETMINDNLARLLNVGIGDTITLSDTDMDKLTLTVSGIFYNVIYNYAYVTMDTLRDAVGFDSDVNAAYVCLDRDAGIYESAAVVAESDYVMGASVNEEFRVMVRQMLSSMKYIVALVTFCAGALAFIVLYNLTNININERIREIATIKVLGFRQWETASYVYRENMVLTLMGAAVGVPLGIWLHSFVMSNIKIDMISFDVKILWPSFVIAIALTVVFAIVVDVVMYFRLDKINMAESLKSVE